MDGDTILTRECLIADAASLLPQHPTTALAEMVRTAGLDPVGLRAWIQTRAQADAGVCCDHGDDLDVEEEKTHRSLEL